jgi:hypothetical protein
MGRPINPTGFDPDYLRQCVDVLSDDPPLLRWRERPPEHFTDGAAVWTAWNKNNAGQTIRPQADGRLRIKIGGRHVDARSVIAEIGVTPVSDRFGPQRGNQPDGPNDRFAHIRDVAGTGPLALVLQEAMRDTGRSKDELTVLDKENDPYRIDTPASRRDAQWFAEWFDRLLYTIARIHLRGFHYLLVAHGGVLKPDGTPYVNSDKDYEWMMDEAGKAARWLGYVPFSRIVDNRNAAPVILRPERTQITPMASALGDMGAAWWREIVDDIEIGEPNISPRLEGFAVDQPYCFAFFGEKSSLEDALTPLAEQFRVNMYLCAGEISDTLIWEMARDGAADGRPLIVFTFSDFDPAGWQMPVSIARKLQALRDLEFPTLRGQVVPVSLTLDQVLAARLPTTPVKAGDKRRDKWEDAFGPALRSAGIAAGREPAQVEIDALAALRIDELRRIARAAIAPYWDATLIARVGEARAQWREAAQAEIDAQTDADDMTAVREEAEEAAEGYNAALADLRAARERLREADGRLDSIAAAIELKAPPEPPEPEINLEAQSPLIDLEWSFEDVTRALKAHRAYEGGGEDGAKDADAGDADDGGDDAE